uniref:Kinesin-like protein KIF22 isoform X3 n=1 Tax=Rhizophora mucronata TaxID=61149 RepID=A0A2P2KYD5_RHIMU
MSAPPPVNQTDRTKAKMGPDPGGNIRVVAKIRESTGQEAPWIFVNKPMGDQSESVTISLGEQSAVSRKECYEVDFCYEQTERNDVIFSKEVKPLISGVIEGRNATVIAHGARCSGKTYLIQGTEDEPGVVVLTMAELLSVVVENGKSISVSLYEIVQDHVYDLLDPKRQEVVILEAQGKVQLKGLSQVLVTSMSQFQKLYDGGRGSRKLEQKIPTELPHRSHKGLIIYVSSSCVTSDIIPAGKINFIDLAGYEDARRKSSDGPNFVENTKINRSIYALQNVVCSLKANESHVPYRESKLTRLLQDSLGGTNRILMITCLSPRFCQESIHMLSLASRCYQCTNQVVSKSTKIVKSSTRSMIASHKAQVSGSFSAAAKKSTVPQVQFSVKKRNCRGSALKARKLFGQGHHLKFAKVLSF